MKDRDLEHAAERFADTLYEAIAVRVQQALVLERDRVDARFAALEAVVFSDELQHSMRVGEAWGRAIAPRQDTPR